MEADGEAKTGFLLHIDFENEPLFIPTVVCSDDCIHFPLVSGVLYCSGTVTVHLGCYNRSNYDIAAECTAAEQHFILNDLLFRFQCQ